MNAELRKSIMKLLKSGTRLDGRKFSEFRKPIEVQCNYINTAEGSARVKIGDTEVIAGVKMEVGKPYPDNPDEGTIIVGAELLPMSSPEFELGPPGIQAVELARVVDRGIRESKTIDFKSLCIKPGEKVWLLLIDVISVNDAGNLLDAASLAALAALKSARFPEYNGEKIDYKKKTDKELELRNLPIAITVIKIGTSLIVDPDSEEEKATDARLTVTSMEDGTLCAMQKGGDAPLTKEDIENMVELAIEKGKELRDCL